MGTRHLICAVLDGSMKLAQYGQWDGYPSGQGIEVLNFLRTANPGAFRDGLRQCRFGTDEEIQAAYADYSTGRWMNMSQVEAFKASPFGHLSRDVSAEILPLIIERPLILQDHSNFALDGLFCEWAYVIDLDAGVLEVYEGFKEKGTPIRGRWAGCEGSQAEYEPVDLVITYRLDELPTAEDFLKFFEKPQDPIDATFEATLLNWSIGEKATIEIEFDPSVEGLAGIEPGTKLHVQIKGASC